MKTVLLVSCNAQFSGISPWIRISLYKRNDGKKIAELKASPVDLWSS
eukprot:Gb_07375 [translate_table: standard]